MTICKRSKDIICSICLDNVIKETTVESEKSTISERFGLLGKKIRKNKILKEGCNHPFCIECIRNWRFKVSSNLPESVKRSCPICRKFSGYVVPVKNIKK